LYRRFEREPGRINSGQTENDFRKAVSYLGSFSRTLLSLRNLDRTSRGFPGHVEGSRTCEKEEARAAHRFFYYCIRLSWINENPAVRLGRIKADGPPTDYFPKEEFDAVIDATYIYQPKGWTECRNQPTRLRTLTWLMRWSGLAIRDAVTLERWRLNEKDELLLYRAKTGNPVYVPLPRHLADSLRNIPPGPKPNPRYFFWSGNGSPKSIVGNWQRNFRRLFQLSNIKHEDGRPKRCHPHMLRDTFAVEMLLAGVPLEQMSMLLGAQERKNYRKTLRTVGESAPGATCCQCPKGLGTGPWGTKSDRA
jgi:integrase/recombinase XerD